MCLSRGLATIGRREREVCVAAELAIGSGEWSNSGIIDCTHVSESTIYGRAILSRYCVILSGPIDFFAFKCCYEFSNFVYCNRWNAESACISKFALAEFFQCGGAFIFFSDISKLFRRS